MEHHMYEHTVAITLYLTYAALMMGLMVCSILSPIRTVAAGGRQLTVYGVAIAFEMPPPGWNDTTPTNPGSSGSSSASFSSAFNAMLSSGEVSNGGVSADTLTLLRFSSTASSAYFSDLTGVAHTPWKSGVSVVLPAANAVTCAASSPSGSCTTCIDSSRGGDDGSCSALPQALGNKTHWMYVKDVPSSALARCMTAYLVFASLCLLFSFLLIVSLFVLILPTGFGVQLRVAIRVFTVAGPLSAILCFAMAAALGLQGKLVRHIADGYYANSSLHTVVSRLHSGFSTSVAAAFIALVVVTLSPLQWKR
jgi:hypothetical protein